jgi:hypothetical protein
MQFGTTRMSDNVVSAAGLRAFWFSARSRLLLVVAVAAGALNSAGCMTDTSDCASVEPVYAGEATDEAWREMIDARPDATSGGNEVRFLEPADRTSLSAASTVTFAWSSSLKLSALPVGLSPLWSPHHRGSPTFLDRLAQTFVPAAHAHLPPITSDLYWLEIDVPSRSCPVSALTTALSFAFPEQDWAVIAKDGGPRTARLMSAFLTTNNVTEGPFLSAPLTFRIEP